MAEDVNQSLTALVHGLAKVGKALDVSTRIRTERGWTTMGEVVVGDRVHTINGSLTSVTAVSEVLTGRNCYEVVTNSGRSLVADADHLWTVMTHDAVITTVTTKEIWNTRLSAPMFYVPGRLDGAVEVENPWANIDGVVWVKAVESRPVRCIQVDHVSGVFLAGKDFLATHNSLLAASLPKPLLYLDVEQGAKFLPMRSKLINLRDPWPKADGSWDVALLPVLDWDTARKALDRMQDRQHPFRAVSTDSIAALQKRIVNAVVGPQEAPEIQQWGEILRELQNYCEQLRDLTAHPRFPIQAMLMTSPTRLDKAGKFSPFLQGQMKDTAPYLFDITGYLYVEPKLNKATNKLEETRFLRTRRTPQIEAGERVGGRIPAVYQLPQVTGATAEEAMRKNVTFQRLMRAVWDPAVATIAAPAATAVPPEPQPVAVGPSTPEGA